MTATTRVHFVSTSTRRSETASLSQTVECIPSAAEVATYYRSGHRGGCGAPEQRRRKELNEAIAANHFGRGIRCRVVGPVALFDTAGARPRSRQRNRS